MTRYYRNAYHKKQEVNGYNSEGISAKIIVKPNEIFKSSCEYKLKYLEEVQAPKEKEKLHQNYWVRHILLALLVGIISFIIARFTKPIVVCLP